MRVLPFPLALCAALLLTVTTNLANAQSRQPMPPTLDACGVEPVAGFGTGVLRGRAEARALREWRSRVRALYPDNYAEPRNSHRASRHAYCFPMNATGTRWTCRAFLRPCAGRTVHSGAVDFRTCRRPVEPRWSC